MPAKRTIAAAFQDECDRVDEDPAVAQLGLIESQMRHFFGGMAKTEVRCHMEYLDRLAFLSHSQAPAYATFDSGADTNVLGKEWLIISTDPLRKINLVGFDGSTCPKERIVHCHIRYYCYDG